MDYGLDTMMTGAVRRPAVAGYFYPSDPSALAEQIDAHTRSDSPAMRAHALIVPHGSYRQAGDVIGRTFARVVIPRRCILLGPSHTGSWMPWSIMARGAYRTPLGDVVIDQRCADALRSRCAFLETDGWGQVGEHAIEVLLPFLQWRGPSDLAVVPIIMGSEHPEELSQLAQALMQVIRMQEEPVLLLASSDLSHYEPQARGSAQDRLVLERIGALDGPALMRIVEEESIRMCGVGAVACVLEASKRLGARRAIITSYGTSAEAGGDPCSVIGYAGVVIPQEA